MVQTHPCVGARNPWHQRWAGRGHVRGRAITVEGATLDRGLKGCSGTVWYGYTLGHSPNIQKWPGFADCTPISRRVAAESPTERNRCSLLLYHGQQQQQHYDCATLHRVSHTSGAKLRCKASQTMIGSGHDHWLCSTHQTIGSEVTTRISLMELSPFPTPSLSEANC